MEDTLRVYLRRLRKEILSKVLILVLMEDTLRVLFIYEYLFFTCVLILVLMEDTLRALDEYTMYAGQWNSLNPCFNGRYS